MPVVILHALDDGIVPYDLGRKVGYSAQVLVMCVEIIVISVYH